MVIWVTNTITYTCAMIKCHVVMVLIVNVAAVGLKRVDVNIYTSGLRCSTTLLLVCIALGLT